MKDHTIYYNHCLNRRETLSLLTNTTAFVILILGLLLGHTRCLFAQPSTQQVPQSTLEGTLTMYMVTRYGDSLQEIDRYRRTNREGEYVAFILKTDEKLDMAQYLERDELAQLVEYDETLQSEFMIVPD